MVEFQNLSYRPHGAEILRGINLQVQEGETLVLLGRSGSGKTTLLKTVNRLIEPTGGQILFQGQPVLSQDPIALRRRIGYVIQDSGLFPHWTAGRNIGLVPSLEGWDENRISTRTTELLEAMSLPANYAARYPRQLSGGEKQRVGIARALAADPPLLLLDEPFSALDPVTRYELQQHFVKLRQTFGKTAIFVTHDIREALVVGTRIALLKKGSVEAVATAEEFPHHPSDEVQAFVKTMATHA